MMRVAALTCITGKGGFRASSSHIFRGDSLYRRRYVVLHLFYGSTIKASNSRGSGRSNEPTKYSTPTSPQSRGTYEARSCDS